jgi:macrolide transport system ATP-binding/permease protein
LREYGEVLEWAQARDAWDADRRATLVLDGLGLAEVDTRRRLDTLLGGPRSRLALAALLVRRPGALLLDEPTNHLDDEAVAFVEAHLRGLPGVVVLASHDRVFLDAVCTAVVDLDPSRAGVTRYGGAYSDYLHAKRAERARWEQQYATEQGELVALRHAVAVTSRLVSHERAPRDNDKMAYDFFGGRVQRQISCRVRNAVQRLDERTARQVRKPPAPLRFAATVTAAGSSGLALSARGLRVSGRVGSARARRAGRAGRRAAPGHRPERVGQVDATRRAGRAVAPHAAVHRAGGMRIGLLEQDVAFSDPQRTPRSLYEGATPLAELGLIAPRDLDRPVGVLSVGQRRRLALALLVARTPHVLLLDETHQPPVADAGRGLEDALRAAPGAVVAASHDRWLRRGWDGPELALHAS